MGDKEDKTNKGQKFFNAVHTNGIKTQRDVWCYGCSSSAVAEYMSRMIGNYNKECERIHQLLETSDSETKEKILSNVASFLSDDDTFISWTSALRNDILKNKEGQFSSDNIVASLYRPFTKEALYADSQFNERLGIKSKAFPFKDAENLVICVSGVGVTKDFTCIITDQLPDLELIGKSQCFPLYWYEERKESQASLFDDDTSEDKFIRRDGITDWILKEVRKRFGNSKAITKEHIFYYVYGILHSPQYRERFAADLKNILL